MFEPDELERVVTLQQKSYALLRWVGESLKTGTLSFAATHEPLELAGAAKEWITRNRENFPPDARPEISEINSFAHLFASYLTTSFHLIEEPGQRLASRRGCYCRFCSYLVSANYLRVRQPDKKAKEKARQMKDLYMSGIAGETVGPVPYATLDTLITDPHLTEDISWATYGHELLRRSRFASQGEGILLLWREIAWGANGKVKKNFALSASRILQAESMIIERLRQAGSLPSTG